MAIINTNGSFGPSSTVTNTTLNSVADAATFDDPVDGTTLELITTGADSGKLRIKSSGVGTTQLAASSVTFSKLDDVIDDDAMATASATTLATSESIKAYTDTRALDPARGYNNLSHNTASGTIIENTTGRPLFVSFTLYSTNDINYLLLEISPNSDMTGATRIAQTRIVSDGSDPSGGQVCGIIPDGWYWKVSYSGSTLSEKVHCSFAL